MSGWKACGVDALHVMSRGTKLSKWRAPVVLELDPLPWMVPPSSTSVRILTSSMVWGGLQIEVFFKQIKQTLQLADFLGTSANAVRWQIWTALLVCLLLRYLAFLSNWSHSFSRLFTLIRVALWKKWDALNLLRRYGTADGHFRYLAQPEQAYFPGIG